MIEIKVGTMEERIIKILQEKYPITIKEIAEEIGVAREKIKVEIIKLQKKGIVDIDILPDKTFVRLIRFDIRFIGRRNQYKFIKKKKRKIKESNKENNDDIMYG